MGIVSFRVAPPPPLFFSTPLLTRPYLKHFQPPIKHQQPIQQNFFCSLPLFTSYYFNGTFLFFNSYVAVKATDNFSFPFWVLGGMYLLQS